MYILIEFNNLQNKIVVKQNLIVQKKLVLYKNNFKIAT